MTSLLGHRLGSHVSPQVCSRLVPLPASLPGGQCARGGKALSGNTLAEPIALWGLGGIWLGLCCRKGDRSPVWTGNGGFLKVRHLDKSIHPCGSWCLRGERKRAG